MNGILKCIAVIAIAAFFLSACGGESSGESSGTMSSGNNLDTSQLSAAALRGHDIYVDPTYGCVSCHGLTGEGTNQGGALNQVSNAACSTCGDIATLTSYNDALMPASPFSPASCTGACASDVSEFILEGFIQGLATGSTPPPPPSPAINVNPTSGLTTTEAGGTASFTIALNTMPTANVDITLMSSNNAEGTVNPTTLTFTAANWNQLQTVMITGVDDAVLDGNIAYNIVTTAASVDADYAAIDPADVSVTNEDNEVPPPGVVTVNPTSGLVTTEDGGTATFTIVLGTQPTADVTIGLSSSNSAEGTVSPASVVFTNVNYNVPQTVTVTGVDDAAAPAVDGNILYSVVTANAVSADPSYTNFTVDDVSVTNNDNDVKPTIATFTADPLSDAANPIAYGGMVTLNWTSDADNCTAGGANAGGQWTGALLANGMQTLTNLTTSGVNTFSITCTLGGIPSDVATVDVTVAAAPGAPTVSLSADPSMNVAYNGSTTLTWTSTGAVGTCTASGGWTGAKQLNGSETINGLVADTTFNLSCVNSIGTPTQVSTTVDVVEVNPALTFTVNAANTATIIKGESVTLAWNPTDLTSCNASAVPANAAWTGSKGVALASYSEVIANVQESTTFTLTCQGINGANVVQSVSVTANPDPELAIGKTNYDAQCANCHGLDGNPVFLAPTPIGPNMCSNNTVPVPPMQEVCGDLATLQNYITNYMTPVYAVGCDADCSRTVSKYILNSFSTN